MMIRSFLAFFGTRKKSKNVQTHFSTNFLFYFFIFYFFFFMTSPRSHTTCCLQQKNCAPLNRRLKFTLSLKKKWKKVIFLKQVRSLFGKKKSTWRQYDFVFLAIFLDRKVESFGPSGRFCGTCIIFKKKIAVFDKIFIQNFQKSWFFAIFW